MMHHIAWQRRSVETTGCQLRFLAAGQATAAQQLSLRTITHQHYGYGVYDQAIKHYQSSL
jgi:hypothetical protein